MRGLKSTIASLVVLIGLGAYIYFVTWKQPEDTGPKLERVFTGLEGEKIEEIKIKSESGDQTTAKKGGGDWDLTAPISTKAEQASVQSIATGLGMLEMTRVIEENASDLKAYGLDTPRFQIEFRTTGESAFKTLLVGQKSPTGADLFAKRGDDKKVFLIPSFQEMTFNRTTFDLRDKTVISVEAAKVDAIEMILGGKTGFRAEREGTDCTLTKPYKARGDYGAVEGLVGRLQQAAMRAVVTENASPSDLKKYGFDKPSAELNFQLASAKATLFLGGKTSENTYYARDASKPLVMTVDAALLDEFKKSPTDYRKKDIVDFRGFNVDR